MRSTPVKRLAFLLSLLLLVASAVADEGAVTVVFLDNRPGVVNASRTYDPATRTCVGGRYRVFTDLASAAKALDTAEVLYLRGGTYTRTPDVRGVRAHGSRVNYWTGAFAIGASGTPEKRKRVSAYRDETVVIQAKPGVSAYNPDPGDDSFRKSSHFYPQPAVSIGGNYLDVSGLKTFGQVVISGHHVTLARCDLGGGGPHMNQGQVVAINSNRPGGVHDVVVRNNHIHHSCWGESRANATALMCYNASFVVEHNRFTDNFGADIRIKDTGGQAGREIVIRYNVFGPSSIAPGGNTGTGGLNQDKQIDRIHIHHNLFLNKRVGACVDGPPPKKGMVIDHNTFVNCRTDLWGWTNAPVQAHHNLFYHAKQGARFTDLQADPLTKLDMDGNLYFATTGAEWRHRYRPRATTLDAWRAYAKCDATSVWKDPDFVNPAGKRPEDFKRKGIAPDLPDGTVCGAYETGKETLGPLPRANPR